MQPSGTVDAQLAVLAEQVAALRSDAAAIAALIHGPPWEQSLRGRLHVLETERIESRASAAVLAAAREERRRAERERRRAERDRRSFPWKVLGTIAGFGVALYPYLAHFSGWGG